MLGLSVTQRISLLRFLGYMGVSCATIAVPMLVYLITKDIKTAGIYLLFEWLCKIFFYAVGGSFLGTKPLRNSMIMADSFRILGYLSLIITFFYHTTFLLLPAIIVIQVGNSISNLIFERSVFYLWEDLIKGYSSLIKLDYLAVAISVIFGIFVNQVLPLLFFSLFLMSINLFFSFHHGNAIFPEQDIKPMTPTQVISNTTTHLFDILTNKNIIYLLFFSICVSSVLNMIFSSLSFFIETFDDDLSRNLRFIAFVVAIRSLLSGGILHTFSHFKGTHISNRNYLQAGLTLWLLSFIGFFLQHSLSFFIACAITGALGNSLLSVWVRNKRNEFIPQDKRNEQISIIIALECLSYIIAGALLTLGKETFHTVLILNIFLLAFALIFISKKTIKT